MTEQLGAMLVQLRQRKGCSQQAMADALCAVSGLVTVTRHEVSRWERQHRIPGAFWLRWLAVVLEVPVTELTDAAAAAKRPVRAAPVNDKGASSPRPRVTARSAGAAVSASQTLLHGRDELRSRVRLEFEHRRTSVRLSATCDDWRQALSAVDAFRAAIETSEPVKAHREADLLVRAGASSRTANGSGPAA